MNTEIRQAIETKYLPATNTKGARIKASAERGRIIVNWDDDLTVNENHSGAATQLLCSFLNEDYQKYGTPIKSNPWNKELIGGAIPSKKNGYVFVLKP